MRKIIMWLRHMISALISDSEIQNLIDFNDRYKFIIGDYPQHLTRHKLNERVACMEEELDEFKAACYTQDLAGQADALIDLVYFAKGTAVMLGLPWAQLWREVHKANMRKIRGIGPRGHVVDLIKPSGWRAPRIKQILKNYGYRRNLFIDARGLISDKKCVDD